ncbi:hypothetical protein [Bacteroides acidifaciens]|uniref:hypothetical protein n=1 Tax=Bacteroides acidifaciens TaxID=85831 RepID=UPI00248C08DF|nr:hypothetical protein [Bacteroides acidifaciens]
MTLNLKICFCTDGDFWFTNLNVLFDKTRSLYEGAEIRYICTSNDQTLRFSLVAIGDYTACKRAAKDLLESLICNIKTSRYYIVDDLCKFLIPAHDVLNGIEKEFEYCDTIHGNYEGTFLHLAWV